MMYGLGFGAFRHAMIGSLGGAVNPLWNNLIGYYTSDNTPNTSIGSVNGTLVNGATYATGKINNAFSFDGVNDYVDLGDTYSFDGTSAFSISTWINLSVMSSQINVISKINNGGNFNGWQLVIINNYLRFSLVNNYYTNNWIDKYSTTALSTNTWYSIVVTYNGSQNQSGLKLYINSVESSYNNIVNSLTSTISTTGLKCAIGCRNGLDNFANGKIDETAVFDSELTSAQVTELYNSGNGLQYI